MPLDISLLEEDNFLTKYVTHYWNMSGGFPEYKFCCALVLLAIATDRKIVMRFNFGTIYTNIWMQILGGSGSSNKSVALTEAEEHISRVFGTDVTLADMFSKEAIPMALSTCSHRVLVNHEVAGLLEGMSRKGSYLAGLTDELCKFFDCRDHYVKKTVKEEYVVNDMFLNMLWCTTPTRFAQSMSEAELDGGLFSRFLICTDNASSDFKEMDAMHVDAITSNQANELDVRLLQIRKSISLFDSLEFRFSDAGLLKFKDWKTQINIAKDNDYQKMIFARIRSYVFRLAAIYYVGSEQFLEDVEIAYHQILEAHGKGKLCDGLGFFPRVTMSIPDKYLEAAITHVNDFFMPVSVGVYSEVVKRNADSTVYKIIKRLQDAENHTRTRSQLLTSLSGTVKASELSADLEVMESDGIVHIQRKEAGNGKEQWIIHLLNADKI